MHPSRLDPLCAEIFSHFPLNFFRWPVAELAQLTRSRFSPHLMTEIRRFFGPPCFKATRTADNLQKNSDQLESLVLVGQSLSNVPVSQSVCLN
jgi:hypothetical protein